MYWTLIEIAQRCVTELIEVACCGVKKIECVIRWAAAIGEEQVYTREATSADDGNERRNHDWTLSKKLSKVC